VDDRRVLSGIVFVNRNGLRWRNAPAAYGSPKTLYNRWKRWGEAGVFTRIKEGLAAADAEPNTVMIDATPAFAGAGSTSRRTARHRACRL
jgi:transposase